MATINYINNCAGAQTVDTSFNGGPSVPVVIPGGSTVMVTYPTATGDALAVTDSTGRTILFTFNVPAGSSSVVFSTVGGVCIMGTGTNLITIDSFCTGSIVTIGPSTDTKINATIFDTLISGPSIFTVSDDLVDVCIQGGTCLTSLDPTTGLHLVARPDSTGTCTLALAPENPATATITNTCSRDAVVIINEVLNGQVVSTTQVTIPAGATISYTGVTDATLIQVCIMGRCVSVGNGGLITLTDRTGFCAPQVGTPPVCPPCTRARCH